MRVLVDTNVLTRVVHKAHPHGQFATAALQRLWEQGHELRIVPQVLYEYWAVATRPASQNGLGEILQEVVDESFFRRRLGT